MNNIKKIAAVMCVAAVCTAFAGCSDKDKSVSSAAADSSADPSAESAADSTPQEDTQSGSGQEEMQNIGEYLRGVADIYATKNYTLECTLSSTEFDGEVKITREVKGDTA